MSCTVRFKLFDSSMRQLVHNDSIRNDSLQQLECCPRDAVSLVAMATCFPGLGEATIVRVGEPSATSGCCRGKTGLLLGGGGGGLLI